MTFNLLQRILILRVKVMFKILPKRVLGMTYPDHIEIDLKAISPVKVFVHECIHFLEPTWNEKTVYLMENRVWRKTTRHDRYLLGRKLYNRKWKVPYD
jgi:hypothetical protein